MDRIIRDTVTRLINTLSQNRTFYTPEYLAQAGFPVFLVQRMRLEMQKHLRESLTVPETEWSDTNTSQARMAWGRFLEAVSTDLRVPSGKTAAVIEAALSDILELLVSPRSFLADYLFETRQELTLEELRERCQWGSVSVLRHGASQVYGKKTENGALKRPGGADCGAARRAGYLSLWCH